MAYCITKAKEKWDNQLNKNYQELLVLLTTEQKERLRIAQQQWVEYREKEVEFSNQFYSDMKGTMWILVAAQTKLELNKQRDLEIERYIDNLTIDK